MFDSARCAQMRVGQAQISAEALVQLRELLSTLGFDQILLEAENQQEKNDATQPEEVGGNPSDVNEAVATVSKHGGNSKDRPEGSGSGNHNVSNTVTQSGTERSPGRNE
ncbi:MAG: hypothetical protein GY811_07280 [Myxococcales bacterium]|nr:hypothetical protein [Myxococcales bacterium]